MNGDHMSEEDGARLLNHALDPGCTMLDAATIYGAGNNEQRLNRAVMHRRGEFTLASKCALAMSDGERILDARPEAVMAAVDGSLERLGTDHIDLYYLHRSDPQVPIEESIGALVQPIEAGKIAAIVLFAHGAVAGSRYPAALQRTVGTEMFDDESAELEATG